MEASESRRAKRSFLEVYKQQCALQDCSPLREVTERLLDNLIDCRADRITHAEWGPILDALKHKNSLKFIAFRSVCQPIGAAKGNVYAFTGFARSGATVPFSLRARECQRHVQWSGEK